MIKHLLLVLCLLFFASCSILSPVKSDPPSAYVLNTVPSIPIQRDKPRSTILVSMPETRPVFNTTQMAYTTKLYRVAYFSQNQWAETPSQMLQPLIVQTLQNTHTYRAVLTPPYSGRYDYVLNTEITQLQQNFTHKPALLQFSLRAQLVSMATNQVIAARQFTVYNPIPKNTPYNGVISANKAAAKVLKQLAAFCNTYT